MESTNEKTTQKFRSVDCAKLYNLCESDYIFDRKENSMIEHDIKQGKSMFLVDYFYDKCINTKLFNVYSHNYSYSKAILFRLLRLEINNIEPTGWIAKINRLLELEKQRKLVDEDVRNSVYEQKVKAKRAAKAKPKEKSIKTNKYKSSKNKEDDVVFVPTGIKKLSFGQIMGLTKPKEK